jgi:mitogen-activated protein kinase kinase kinase 5
VRSTDRKIIATTLSKLKLELDFDSHGISQVQVVLFGFQDAVSARAAISPQTLLRVGWL